MILKLLRFGEAFFCEKKFIKKASGQKAGLPGDTVFTV